MIGHLPLYFRNYAQIPRLNKQFQGLSKVLAAIICELEVGAASISDGRELRIGKRLLNCELRSVKPEV